MGLLRPVREKVLPEYLLYAYLSPDFQSTIEQRKIHGCTVDRIALKELPNFPIRIPPLLEQKAIAHILGSLDDKIELNRRMNETLEGMAQALFKSWFVVFEPVIDNILAKNIAKCPSPNLSHGERDLGSSPSGRSGDEGSIFDGIPEEFAERAEIRRKALADGTANREVAKHFPAAFQETEEMGWTPEGWNVKELRDVSSKISKGTTPRKADMEGALDEPTIPFIKVRDISDSGHLSESGLELIPRSIHEKTLT